MGHNEVGTGAATLIAPRLILIMGRNLGKLRLFLRMVILRPRYANKATGDGGGRPCSADDRPS